MSRGGFQSILLCALVGAALAGPIGAGTPRGATPTSAVFVHELFHSQKGAVVLMRRNGRAVDAGRVDLLPASVTVWRYPEPLGEGTWVELLTREYRNLGAFRAAVPEGPDWCGVELPLVPGTWWVLVVRQVGGQNRLLGRFRLGPKLMRLASGDRRGPTQKPQRR